MAPDSRLPESPLEFIRASVQKGAVLWTYHVNMRLQGRFIERRWIIDSVKTYELIESYTSDKYLQSYLVLAQADKEVFHVLFAVDVSGDNVRIVTAYRPSLGEWQPDLRTRRTTQ